MGTHARKRVVPLDGGARSCADTDLGGGEGGERAERTADRSAGRPRWGREGKHGKGNGGVSKPRLSTGQPASADRGQAYSTAQGCRRAGDPSGRTRLGGRHRTVARRPVAGRKTLGERE
eukprot:1649655-Pleurochrysis_carterae.AAC.1